MNAPTNAFTADRREEVRAWLKSINCLIDPNKPKKSHKKPKASQTPFVPEGVIPKPTRKKPKGPKP